MADLCLETIDANCVLLTVLDHEKREIAHQILAGQRLIDLDRLSYESQFEGLNGWALKELKPVKVSPQSMDQRIHQDRYSRYIELGGGAALIVPLHLRDHVFGVLFISRLASGPDFDDASFGLARAIANQLITALEQTSLLERGEQTPTPNRWRRPGRRHPVFTTGSQPCSMGQPKSM